MTCTYRPRSMPKRFTVGMPADVKREVLDILAIKPATPLDYDVIFRHVEFASDPYRAEMTGLDFGDDGARGCHFCLHPHEMRAYRERRRRHRVAWLDLPEATRAAIERYVREPADEAEADDE